MLEVTSLLHQKLGDGKSLVQECKAIFDLGASVPELPPDPKLEPIVRNTFSLIREVRRSALQENDCRVYALMVFDCAMVQLGGLAVQSRGNKITNPEDVVLLADLTSKWLLSMTPAARDALPLNA